MNLRFQMVDTDTGEILGTSYKNYALKIRNYTRKITRTTKITKYQSNSILKDRKTDL